MPTFSEKISEGRTTVAAQCFSFERRGSGRTYRYGQYGEDIYTLTREIAGFTVEQELVLQKIGGYVETVVSKDGKTIYDDSDNYLRWGEFDEPTLWPLKESETGDEPFAMAAAQTFLEMMFGELLRFDIPFLIERLNEERDDLDAEGLEKLNAQIDALNIIEAALTPAPTTSPEDTGERQHNIVRSIESKVAARIHQGRRAKTLDFDGDELKIYEGAGWHIAHFENGRLVSLLALEYLEDAERLSEAVDFIGGHIIARGGECWIGMCSCTQFVDPLLVGTSDGHVIFENLRPILNELSWARDDEELSFSRI